MANRPLMAVLLAVVLSVSKSASAEPLPSVGDLRVRIGSDPIIAEVIEPHLSVGESHTTVEYVGYPAGEVLSVVLGNDWRENSDEIEFRALDGYVSRIEVTRFEPGKAFIVFSRADQTSFVVDNRAQNQENIPLGPYYLVWNNIAFPELLTEGATNWPYQVNEILPSIISDDALLPEGLAAPYRRGAELAKAHCLNCHRVNGYGGDKFVGDLAAISKNLARDYFVDWVLNPSSLMSNTTMPALTAQMSEAERVQIAAALYNYLINLPAPQ